MKTATALRGILSGSLLGAALCLIGCQPAEQTPATPGAGEKPAAVPGSNDLGPAQPIEETIPVTPSRAGSTTGPGRAGDEVPVPAEERAGDERAGEEKNDAGDPAATDSQPAEEKPAAEKPAEEKKEG